MRHGPRAARGYILAIADAGIGIRLNGGNTAKAFVYLGNEILGRKGFEQSKFRADAALFGQHLIFLGLIQQQHRRNSGKPVPVFPEGCPSIGPVEINDDQIRAVSATQFKATLPVLLKDEFQHIERARIWGNDVNHRLAVCHLWFPLIAYPSS